MFIKHFLVSVSAAVAAFGLLLAQPAQAGERGAGRRGDQPAMADNAGANDQTAAAARRERRRTELGRAARGAAFGGAGQRSAKQLRHDQRLNVIDATYYEIAEIYLAKKQHEEAVAVLEQLIRQSPDDLAKSLTYLNLASIYRQQLNNPEKALAYYEKVTGEYTPEALDQVALTFENLGQVDRAVEYFEKMAKRPRDNMQKVLALRKLAQLLVRNDREEEAIAALWRLTKAVSYQQAGEISKVLLETQARRAELQQQESQRMRTEMMRRWQGQLRAGRQPQTRRAR